MKKFLKCILIVLSITMLLSSFGCKVTKSQIKKDFKTIQNLVVSIQNVVSVEEIVSLKTQNEVTLKEQTTNYLFSTDKCSVKVHTYSLSDNPGIGEDLNAFVENDEEYVIDKEDALSKFPSNLDLSYDLVWNDYTRDKGKNDTHITFKVKNDKASDFLNDSDFDGSNLIVDIVYTKNNITSIDISYTTNTGNIAKKSYSFNY